MVSVFVYFALLVLKFLVLFRLLPKAAILDVLSRIVPPVYTPLYIHKPGLSLLCTLPLSKYLPVKIYMDKHSILSHIQFKIVAWGNKRKVPNFCVAGNMHCGHCSY